MMRQFSTAQPMDWKARAGRVERADVAFEVREDLQTVVGQPELPGLGVCALAARTARTICRSASVSLSPDQSE
jgi:hypothetical protein